MRVRYKPHMSDSLSEAQTTLERLRSFYTTLIEVDSLAKRIIALNPPEMVQPEVWISEFDDEDFYSSGALLEDNIYYPTFQAACQAAETHCADRFHHDVTPMVWTERKPCPSVFMAKRPQTDPDITWVGDGCYFVSKLVMAE